MKNIHVLPTDKSQNIKLSLFENKLYLGDIASTALPQHIYITSDEEIKISDYILCNNEVYKWHDNIEESDRKIILTTDDDLINDGVQAIDNEFLEWFVKNPSCEEVKVFEQYRKCCRNTDGKNENCIEPINCEGWLNDEYKRPYKTNCEERFEGYKIIIPKEDLSYTTKSGVNISDEFVRTFMIPKEYFGKEKPKQETLEEITEQIQKDCHKFVESIISKVTYQDATNTFLFMKLAELTLKLKKYE